MEFRKSETIGPHEELMMKRWHWTPRSRPLSEMKPGFLGGHGPGSEHPGRQPPLAAGTQQRVGPRAVSRRPGRRQESVKGTPRLSAPVLQEIASYLITFEKHDEWLSCAPKTR